MAFLSVSTPATSTQERVSGWLFANELSIITMGGSGWSPNPDEAQPSVSRSPSEEQRARRHILIVEDNAADVFLIRTAIQTADIPAHLHVVRDGEQALKFFEEADQDAERPCPSLVILDINLPKKQGGEVLEQMRKSGRCCKALVIAVSTSDSPADRLNMLRLGANGYFHKPSEYKDFMKLGDVIKGLLAL